MNSSIDWEHAASLHRSNDGGGLLADLKAVRHGTFAELIRFVASLPEEERSAYEIEKAGDRRIGAVEIVGLSQRPDFPG